MINMELTYWYTFECIPGSTIKRERKNRLYVDYFRSHVNNEKEKVCSRVSLVDFYDDTEYLNSHLTPDELSAINESKVQLPNSSFIVEDLLSQGYNLIPLDSPNYPDSIKKKLKLKSPLLLYVKGNMDLLKAPATATPAPTLPLTIIMTTHTMVGSRVSVIRKLLLHRPWRRQLSAKISPMRTEQPMHSKNFQKEIIPEASELKMPWEKKSSIHTPSLYIWKNHCLIG